MRPVWNDLVSAYDEDYEAVEAARTAWGEANEALLAATLHGLDSAVREARLSAEPAKIEDHVAKHRRFTMAVVRPGNRTGVSLRLRCARPYGGPAASLRVILRFRDAPGPAPATPRSEVWAAVDKLAGPLPGEAWSMDLHPDISPDDRPLRICTVPLAGLGVDGITSAVQRDALELLTRIAVPVTDACDAPLRSIDEARAALPRCEARVRELVGGRDWDVQFHLRPWSQRAQVVSIESDYTDVAIGVDPDQRLLFVCAKADDTLRAVAADRGNPVVQAPHDGAYGIVALAALDGPERADVAAIVLRTLAAWVR